MLSRRSFLGKLTGLVIAPLMISLCAEATTDESHSDRDYQLLLEYHDKQYISTQTLMKELGLDYDKEVKALRQSTL